MHNYKKYIVFAWVAYGADGGASDIEGSFDTKDECKKFIEGSWLNKFQVINRDTWEDVTNELECNNA